MAKAQPKKIGRPKMADADRRDRQPRPLFVKLTPTEREEIDAGANVAGKPTSVWAREQLLRLARRLVG